MSDQPSEQGNREILRQRERLLPALRMMAQFPTRSVAVASFYTGVELDELQQWVTSHGRLTKTQVEELQRDTVGRMPKTRRRRGRPTPMQLTVES